MRYQLLYAIAWTVVPAVFLFSWWLETYSDSHLAEILRGFFATRFAPARKIARRLIWTIAALCGALRRYLILVPDSLGSGAYFSVPILCVFSPAIARRWIYVPFSLFASTVDGRGLAMV